MRFIDQGVRYDPFAEAVCAVLGVPDDLEGRELREFTYGTLEGMYATDDKVFDVVAVSNCRPGNGHFSSFVKHLKRRCLRDGKTLRFREMMNDRLSRHLCRHHGFRRDGDDCVLDYSSS